MKKAVKRCAPSSSWLAGSQWGDVWFEGAAPVSSADQRPSSRPVEKTGAMPSSRWRVDALAEWGRQAGRRWSATAFIQSDEAAAIVVTKPTHVIADATKDHGDPAGPRRRFRRARIHTEGPPRPRTWPSSAAAERRSRPCGSGPGQRIWMVSGEGRPRVGQFLRL